MTLKQMLRKAHESGTLAKNGIDCLVGPMEDGSLTVRIAVGKTAVTMSIPDAADDAEEATEALQISIAGILKSIGADAVEFVHQRQDDITH